MDLDRDKELLAQYQAELDDLDKRIAPLQARREGIRVVVEGLRKVVGVEPDDDSGTVLEASRAAIHAREVRNQAQRQRRHVQVGLKALLAGLIEERGRIDVEDAMAFVAGLPEFSNGNAPSRNTVVSRLGDLVRNGEADSPERGVYTTKDFDLRLGGPSSSNPFTRRAVEGAGGSGDPPTPAA